MTFSLMWDGRMEVLWTYEGADGWFPLKRAQFPDFAEHFDKVAPADVHGYSPPFLGASTDTEPGLIQIWTGWLARTAPDWGLLIRPPANLPRPLGYECYRGIVETDRWFGPLFVNLRLIRTHAPIEFDANFPLLQVQPVAPQPVRQGAGSVRGRPGARTDDARRTGTLSARPSCDRSTVRCGIQANTPPRRASGASRSPDPDNKRPNQTKNYAKLSS